MRPKGYELSQYADQDLEEIFGYTAAEYGFDQAAIYLTELEQFFRALVLNAETGKARYEVKAGLRCFAKSSRIIFYSIDNQVIRVVRVLHGSSDLPRWID